MRETFLPFSRPSIGDLEKERVGRVLDSGWLTTGPVVTELETTFARLVGAGDAIAFSSATSAFHGLYSALGYGEGDEVIFPSMTWPSPANVLELSGGRAVFADIHPRTLQMDLGSTRARITERTRAIVVVHFGGQPVDLDGFRRLAGEHDLLLIEDAAHAIGTTYGDAPIGSGSEPAVFSLHAAKNVTAGEGGLVTTSDPELARRLRLLRFHGVDRDAWQRHGGAPGGYDIEEPGWKHNLTDLQAALALAQLERLPGLQARREELATRYEAALGDVEGLLLVERVPGDFRHGRHLFQVLVEKERFGLDRDTFRQRLREMNIGTGYHFRAVHTLTHYARRRPADAGPLPASEAVSDSTVSLPFFPDMTDGDLEDVVEAIRTCRDRDHDRS